MKILSFDSATECATCALLEDDKLLGEISFNYKKQHSILIMPMIDELLKNTDTSIDDIDGFAISKGPGSFTGLRIGMATFKGLSAGGNKPIIGISTLDAIAFSLAYTPGIICPIMDALRENVYTGVYRFHDDKMITLVDPMIINIKDLMTMLNEFHQHTTFLGDGVYKYKSLIMESFDAKSVNFAPTHLNMVRASSIGELGFMLLKDGKCDNPLTLHPIYLRKPQAEREYEEKYHKGIED
ncbi:tRNA threonylcarbamoyl adenosine modification protein YeaZ [Hathewaya proteolytica DSM 3090]|uniref:tRNA threonylcarbamoyl adenosine modification protein YeaZ n=1 Tax=Hathewaya proteolytica DSM 3090 TaxID=1121331 RepID=A0A1M6RMX8_9CLOT|nr:tRNA (adenosine(37)-N6)-threonylcarbamoyltransferase complex dimerization subunit type 1 TsaB [Hathewaya proteolytica]SHK33823.1 tRNA threonylcarbamoyl adenosine modification protein YeaZ [Hathewaya proteolytica DSM 3090]